jgi:hypothetical protein
MQYFGAAKVRRSPFRNALSPAWSHRTATAAVRRKLDASALLTVAAVSRFPAGSADTNGAKARALSRMPSFKESKMAYGQVDPA